MVTLNEYLNKGLRRTRSDEPKSPAIPTEQIRRDALAGHVIAAFTTALHNLSGHRREIAQLWDEFDALTSGETIMGCPTKTEFVERRLRRTPQTLLSMAQGTNLQNQSDSGDTALDALINEQDHVIGQITEYDNEALLRKAISLENEIVARIVRSNWKEE